VDDIADVLRAAALDLTRTLDPDAVLEVLLEQIGRVVPYDTANVMLLEDEHWMCARATRGYERFADPALTRHARFDVHTHPILGGLVASRRPILIPDTREHPDWQRHVGADHVRNFIGVPLIADGRIIGLYALDKAEPGFFTEAHVRLVEAMAPHAALAITNARLFEQIQRREERFRALVENSNEVVLLLDRTATITYVSQAVAAILGEPAEAQLGRNAFDYLHPDDIDRCRDEFARCLAHPALPISAELRMRRSDGTWRLVEAVGMNRLPDPAVGAIVVNYRDVTERKRAEEQIRALAYQDTLTGLPNRLLFNDRLALGIAHAYRHGQRLAVLFLDVDRLKVVNDSLGHAVGDRVIQAVGARLRAAVREVDTVARLGGDEFILLLPDVGQAVDAAKVAEKVLESLREPLLIEGREIVATASIGISLYPDDGQDAESLLKNADAALYRAKDRGRDTYQIYTAAMNASALEQLALESAFRKALAQGELLVYYQPIVDLGTGRIHAVEALLRWRHPQLGVVRPADFINLAEITGLIVPVGQWVLRTACAQVLAWHALGRSELKVAVNLSARQFQQPDLAAQVERALADSGLSPRHLVLEIAESHAMLDAEATARALYDLRSLGVGLAIDDFGTGYSSLSYLKRFPLDSLKIDTSFVRDLPGDPDDAAIAAAVIELARTLKLEVVAEGVETEDQLHFLAARRCDLAQGHLLCPPLPAADCTEVVARAPSWLELVIHETPAGTTARTAAAAPAVPDRE